MAFRHRILPLVLYGCETWCLTLRKVLRLRMFENKLLRRVFGPKRDEVTRDWGELLNGRSIVCTLRQMSDQIKENEMGEVCSAYGEDEKCVQNFAWKAFRPPRRRRHK
jgi:hypothetical protein